MKIDRVLHELEDHQRRIISHMTASRRLSDEGPAAIPRLSKARWEVVRLLRRYQLLKHTEIFDPLIRVGEPNKRAEAQRLKAQCLAASDGFADYVRRWSAADVAAEWHAYVPAMHGQIDRLRGHLLRERVEIGALLAGRDRTRRAAGDGGR